jgi:hypothetical protein
MIVRLSLSKVIVRLRAADAGQLLLLLGEPGHLDLQVAEREAEADPLRQVRRHGVGHAEHLADTVKQRQIGLIQQLVSRQRLVSRRPAAFIRRHHRPPGC